MAVAQVRKNFEFFAERGFEKRDFFGIAPAQLRVKNTTVFTRGFAKVF